MVRDSAMVTMKSIFGHLRKRSSNPFHAWSYSWDFWVSRSNGAISGSIKSKMVVITWHDMTEDIDKSRAIMPFAKLLWPLLSM